MLWTDFLREPSCFEHFPSWAYSINFFVWQLEVDWLQWCPDPQNQLRGLGATQGPHPAPEVAPDPGPGSTVTGKLYFMNHHSVGCIVFGVRSNFTFLDWPLLQLCYFYFERPSSTNCLARFILLEPGFKLTFEGKYRAEINEIHTVAH